MKSPKLTRDKKLDLYKKLVATEQAAILKGDTIPYTSLNGHMYSFLSKQDEFSLKLPPPEIPKFLEKYKSRLAENYGVVQKDYVVVPDSLLEKTGEIKKYFQMSYNYVSSLKPKPTSKTKK